MTSLDTLNDINARLLEATRKIDDKDRDPKVEKIMSERKKMVMDNLEKTEAEREQMRKSFGE